MKLVYWRPQKVSKSALLLVGALALCGLTIVEMLPATRRDTHYQSKLAAAQLANTYMQTIKRHRPAPLNSAFDPAATGMVGKAMTPITSRPAYLEVKQKAVNPNFAAGFLQLLVEAGVDKGDVVAVGWSGSFPGFNASLAAALETLEVRPIIVASVMASQYGANEPDYVWLDMERTLAKRRLISFRSSAATIGGPADRGMGMTAESIEAAHAAMQRNGIRPLASDRLQLSIDSRMKLYDQRAGESPIAAYVNVGGGIASTGGTKAKPFFNAGLNLHTDSEQIPGDGVIRRFLARGVPVIHLGEVELLAAQFGIEEDVEALAQVGAGAVFAKSAPSRLLAAVVLVLLGLALRAFVLTDVGHQMWQDFLSFTGSRSTRRLKVVSDTDTGPQLMA